MGAAKSRGTYEHRKALAIVKRKAEIELKKQQEQAAWDAMSEQEKEEYLRKKEKAKDAYATLLAIAEMTGVYPYII